MRANIAMNCESIEGVKRAVRDGVGVGLLYRDNVAEELGRGEMKLIKFTDVDMRNDSYIIYRVDKRLSPSAEMFLNLLRRHRREPRPATRRAVRRAAAANVLSLAPLWLPGFICSLIGQAVEDASVLGATIL